MLKRLLKPVFLRAASLFGIPQLQQRMDDVEARIHASVLSSNSFDVLERRVIDLAMAQMTPLRNQISDTAANAENRLISLNESLVSYINAKQLQNEEIIALSAQEQTTRISEIRQTVDTIRRQLGSPQKVLTVQSSAPKNIDVPQLIDDSLYVALENHFRGSRDVVAQRQSDYLSILPTNISSEHPLVDLGCGRGEWLKVLRENGLHAVGVDSNSVCIAECIEEGLEVVQDDLLQYLKSRNDQSVGTYTLFQVLEHLPFATLVDVLREMRRSLVPGGRIIAEVPNAKNLRVSAGTFWIDPTHQRPLFPELLLFLATEVGYAKAEGKYTNVLGPEHDLSGLPEKAKDALASVLDALDGPGDFALIATA